MDVRRQVEKIVASAEFAVPDRGRRLLQYLVDETLAGRAHRIKAYTVALEVFGRDASFDAQNDPVVRIEAGRIRRALERYYLIAGQSDLVAISIPKGGYVPLFRLRDKAGEGPALRRPTERVPALAVGRASWPVLGVLTVALILIFVFFGLLRLSDAPQGNTDAAALQGPQVLIEPFTALGDAQIDKTFALGLTAEVTNQLARFKEINVIVRSAADADVSSFPGKPGPHYAVDGNVRVSNDQLRLIAQLRQTATGAVLWTEAYDSRFSIDDLIDVQMKVADGIAATLGQSYGVIFRADAARMTEHPPQDFDAYVCTLRFFSYRVELEEGQHASARDCLEQAVARHPNYSTAWALLSLTYLDEDRFQYNPKPNSEDPLIRALAAARRAVELDGFNVRALQALMLAEYLNGHLDKSLATGERALALNPNDTEFLGEFGMRLAVSGNWDRGKAVLEQALSRNPSSGYVRVGLALGAYMDRDYARAGQLIAEANLAKNPLYSLIAIAIYGQLGDRTRAQKASEDYFITGATFHEQLGAEMAKRNIRPIDQKHLVDGLKKSGFPLSVDVLPGSSDP